MAFGFNEQQVMGTIPLAPETGEQVRVSLTKSSQGEVRIQFKVFRHSVYRYEFSATRESLRKLGEMINVLLVTE